MAEVIHTKSGDVPIEDKPAGLVFHERSAEERYRMAVRDRDDLRAENNDLVRKLEVAESKLATLRSAWKTLQGGLGE